MRLIGCLLLVSGFFIAAAAMVLMHSMGRRMGFVLSGIVVEGLGLGLMMSGYKAMQKDRR